MRFKFVLRKNSFVLAVTATILAFTQSATAGEICENDGFNVCQSPTSTLTTNNQGINTGTGSTTTTNVTAGGTLGVTGVSTLSGGLDVGGNPITNVAPGVAATDAVTVSQLSSAQGSVRGSIDALERKAMKGIAISDAMEVFMPDPEMMFRVTASAGFYDSEQALGITGAGRITKNVALFGGAAADVQFDRVAGKAGVSFQW